MKKRWKKIKDDRCRIEWDRKVEIEKEIKIKEAWWRIGRDRKVSILYWKRDRKKLRMIDEGLEWLEK